MLAKLRSERIKAGEEVIAESLVGDQEPARGFLSAHESETRRQEFDDSRFAADQLRYHQRQETKLRAKAKATGFQLISMPQAG